MSIKSKTKKIVNPKSYYNGLRYVKNNGLKKSFYRVFKPSELANETYLKWRKNCTPDQDELKAQTKKSFKYSPLISIIVPCFKTEPYLLNDMIDSVKKQTYSNWELCISDGSGLDSPIKESLINFSEKDKRIKCDFSENSLCIADNTNNALTLSTGDYIAFLDHDDVLAPEALYEVVSALQDKKHYILYSDEDYLKDKTGVFTSPIFKPDWSPDLLCSHNYITHFLVVKKSLVEKVGGFNKEYDGAQDYDFVFRCTETSNDIYHIPKILYHWRICSTSVAYNSNNKLYAYENGKKAIAHHLDRLNINYESIENMDVLGYYHVKYSTSGNPLVSIIIPNKDHIDDLKKCIDSLLQVNTYKNIEIIICENNSEDKKTFDYYDDLKNIENIKILHYKGSFNYSKINNYAAESAKGEYLLFLNNDTELINPDSISEMLGTCMLDHVGVVGAKLLYEDNTIQHAGAVLGFGGCAGHVFNDEPLDFVGYCMRPNIICNYSAVTAACMCTKKEIFNKVGGFSENFVVALNDIDYCLKVRELNMYVVFNSESLFYHYESKSRGYEDSPAKQQRFNSEIRIFQDKWLNILKKGDPFYNKNFLVNYIPYKLKEKDDIICFSVDEAKIISDAEKKQIYIKGWGFSTKYSNLNIKVYRDDIEVNFSIDWKIRKDIEILKLNRDKDFKCGYNLKFDYSDMCKYRLIIYTNDSKTEFVFNNENQLRALFKVPSSKSGTYNDWFIKNRISIEELKLQKSFKFFNNPKISVVVPLYKTPHRYLKMLVKSILQQSYQNWELCLSEGSGSPNYNIRYLKKLMKSDKRIKVVFSSSPLNISANTNAALQISTGNYIAFADHDDVLEPNALFECVKAINKSSNIDFIYTDEDKISFNGKTFFDPHFKSDYNIDMLRSVNYFCHLCVVRRDIYELVGGLRPEFDGAQDYDFVLRCIEKCKNVYHIPKILYHWRAHSDSTAENPESKLYAFDNGKKAIREHYKRLNIKAEVEDVYIDSNRIYGFYRTKYILTHDSLISIIIPNKDHIDDLDKCLKSIYHVNQYNNIEVIIVENNSTETETFQYYKKIKQMHDNLSVVEWGGKSFNYPLINNFGVSKSKGEYILFLNNDTEFLSADSLSDMLSYCQRDDVGAVGAKLYYPDDTIQHAGVIVGILGVAGHAFLNDIHDSLGYFGRTIIAHDLSCCTAACLLVKRKVFDIVNGFDEGFAVAFNDVDFCLKIREAGYLIVYDPFAQLYHYESKSRGVEDSPEKVERFNNEVGLFRKKWLDFLKKGDPYYNPNLSLDSNNFEISST